MSDDMIDQQEEGPLSPDTPPAQMTDTSPSDTSSAPADLNDGQPYRVLARKYRPQSFADMIGQDALVRTLKNAIEKGRLPHAVVLTGVRGVGKTTTARIIAKAINYAGPDGTAGPTVGNTDDCPICQSIAEDRHPDVIEMDAASRTGVDDIRELIESVRYRPVSARYKVYIIDEVHMLSRNAFNALLKTLEEPPESVVFIFATTEIRKVPVTVLSRCMRFDLRRIDQEDLAGHFARICDKEGVSVEEEGLSLIARAADGSARDGLSLLDQAISLGDGQVITEQVKTMLGLADSTRVYDLFDQIMQGDVPGSLTILEDLYNGGSDPAVVLQDLLDLTHKVTRLKLVPSGTDQALSEAERVRGREMADKLSIPLLTRSWQLLMKGLSEVQQAASPLKATEMVLIRLIYAAELPDPADLIKKLQKQPAGSVPAGAAPSRYGPSAPSSGGDAGASAVSGQSAPGPDGGAGPTMSGGRATVAGGMAPQGQPVALRGQADPQYVPNPRSFEAIFKLLSERKEGRLASHLRNDVRLVNFQIGRLEINPSDRAPADIAGQVGRLLTEWTGTRWIVAVSEDGGDATLADQDRERQRKLKEEVLAHPLVRAALAEFPGAELGNIRLSDEEIAAQLDMAEEQELVFDDDLAPEEEADFDEGEEWL
ncbi:DNA polymerase III subunit gamma/tau [Rhodovibrionaceae bacterium A322]